MADPMANGSAFPGTSASRRRLRQTTALTAVMLAAALPAAAEQLPTGGTVVQGSAAIATPNAQNMIINQSSGNAIVNWQGFSIGQNAQVTINQPGTGSAILNRVTGGASSDIHGQLNANGQVFLVNPNGIFIGPSGRISSSGFVGSTLDINDEDFMAGRLKFSGNGASAKVTNAGRITIGQGGYAALLGGRVENSGVVSVPLGRVGFGAGERATLDLSGDRFLQVALPSADDGDGEALIVNSGTVTAEGGRIEMLAATARDAARNAINMSGVAEATSVSVRDGVIMLGGGSGGTVTVTGRVSTAALDSSPRPPERPAQGGEITVTGARIVLDGAQIDASGPEGGGTIRIGGDFGGAGALPHAQTVTADADTVIRADATKVGDGGRIVLWSDLFTDASARFSARGGASGGDGGFVEVSSAGRLRYNGIADLRAPAGSWGMLWLDPDDISVPGTIAEATLEAQLNLGDVTLDTANPSGPDVGNITINASIDWTAATTLALIADNNIILNGAINAANGILELDAAGSIFTGSGGAINVADFRLLSGAWQQVGATLPAFSADNFFISFSASFLRALGGDGSAANPYQLTDVYGLQGVGSSGMNNSSYILANNIDANSTGAWTFPFGGSSAGFEPIFDFGGTLDGNGHTIDGLFIDTFNGEGYNDAGLFASITSTGTVHDLLLTGADVTGAWTGVLAGSNAGTIFNVWAEGTILGNDGRVGGLVGSNSGTIGDSIADVSVGASIDPFISFSSDYNIGGFVGFNDGTIVRSHALGDVTVNNIEPVTTISAGGFVGQTSGGTISDSYAHGDVAVTSNVGPQVTVNAGGFVGLSAGEVSRSYSIGSATASGDAFRTVGGFAGSASLLPTGAASNFWDRQSSGLATSAYGTALNTSDFQTTATFVSLGSARGWNFTNVWAPGDTGFYPVNYTTSPVIYARPDPVVVPFGQTGSATTTGTYSGGPSLYVFDLPGNSLNTGPLFSALNFSGTSPGPQTFTLATTSLSSSTGPNFRVVDLPGTATILPPPPTPTPPTLTPPPPPPPPVVFTLPNPTDTITGTPSLPTDTGTTLVTSTPGKAGETLSKVQDVATTLEIAAQSCAESDSDVSRYLACLSDALNDFANELDKLSTDLPPGLENVARIVQDARAGVDQARARAEQRLASATTDAEREAIRTDAINEARTAIDTASTEIRKAIRLVRADDPELANLQREQIVTIAAAVDSVGIELSRAVGL
ncbi:filamentous hemagglutinin N-terminal domain-containing protein [Defluviimonas sp. WL0024]|uniref:Filamentous hemagglutinin N-terminal domain-containing protein n=1 Tax=Albidovulum salinarum TaxID=2984153 RepID=A0ABT2X7D9_9RHOB|nr:filamentous hemagglutinin N-terminal domain-containing protein [Defluviimonas sp. WL0024]MCU9849867.1 filamentous hemagglutinin N-terminal domain-containing protein [Defluviimonas sp. WL0024]